MLNLSSRLAHSFKSGKIWVVIMMCIGAFLTIVYKFQNTMYVFEGPAYKPNFHPFIQALNMFIGQLISLPIFYFLKHRNHQKYVQKQRKAILQGKKLHMNKLYLLMPAFFDLLTSTMQFIALNFISASAYQMLKGGTIITTFILSLIFLAQPLLRRQLVGSCLALIGIVVVGLANVVFIGSSGGGDGEGEGDGVVLEIVGYILMIGSLFTNGFFFVVQQKLMEQYHLQPLQIVGYQGLFGIAMYLVLIPVLCFTPCYFGPNACVFSRQGFTYVQGVTVYFDQLRQNPSLIALGIISIFGILVFNVAGVTVTKYINALARAIANMTKSIFVWMLRLIVTIAFGDRYPNLKWEKLQPWIIILQIVGFIFMVFGNFIYNDIIKISMLKQKNANDPLLSSQDNKSSKQITQQNLLEKQINKQ